MSQHPPPPPITRSRGLSDSLGLGAGARLSRCLSPTLPSGRLPPERRGPCARRSPGGRRARPGAHAESSSPELVSPALGPRGVRAGAAASPRVATAGMARRAPAAGAREVGRWWPAGPRAARPRAPAAAEPLCPETDVGREEGVAAPPAGRSWGARGLGECGVGVGRSCGDQSAQVPFAPQTPVLLVPHPDPSGAGPGVRGDCPRLRASGAGKGGRGCVREAGISFPRTSPGTTRDPSCGSRAGTGGVSSPEAAGPGSCLHWRLKVRPIGRSWVRNGPWGSGRGRR